MKHKIQVYHYIPGFHFGGIESRFVELYKYIDKERFQYHVITYTGSDTSLLSEIEKNQGTILTVEPVLGPRFLQHNQAMKRIFTENQVDIAYCYTPESGFVFLRDAEIFGVKKRIMHARTSSFAGDTHKIMRSIFKSVSVNHANINLAVSHEAGNWMFGNKPYTVMPNAVCLDRYLFSETEKARIRRQYGVGDGLLIGHVGRNTFAKNHGFLFSVFVEVMKRVPDAKLMLVGVGDDDANIVELCRQNGIEKRVIFCGYQKNPAPFYSAMNLLVFPSFYEGFPGTIVEAQANGLRCLLSDTITGEVGLTPDVEYLSLSRDPSAWADRIIERSVYERKDNRISIEKAGYSIKEAAKRLMNLYTTGKYEDET